MKRSTTLLALGAGSWGATLPGSTPSSSATTRNNNPPSPPPIAIPRPPPPPDDAVVLVSICIPSLKVIALSVAVFGVAGGPARSALHTTIQACLRLPKFLRSRARRSEISAAPSKAA